MEGVEYEPLVALLDAHREDGGHRGNSRRKQKSALASKNEVKVLIFFPLRKHMVAFSVLFLQEVNFELLELFKAYFVLVTQVRHKAH